MNNPTITLESNIQHNMFVKAMATLRDNRRTLSKYDFDLLFKLTDAYDLLGRDMGLTRKQLEHIKQVAYDLERGLYRG